MCSEAWGAIGWREQEKRDRLPAHCTADNEVRGSSGGRIVSSRVLGVAGQR